MAQYILKVAKANSYGGQLQINILNYEKRFFFWSINSEHYFIILWVFKGRHRPPAPLNQGLETKLSYAPFDILGIKHNEIIFDFSEKMLCSTDSLTFNYLVLLQDSFPEEYFLFRDHLFETSSSFYLASQDSMSRGLLSPRDVLHKLDLSVDLKNSINELFDIIDQSLDYNSFLVEMENELENKKSLLTNEDLIYYYSCFAVAKYSYYLWSPVEKGGIFWQDSICVSTLSTHNQIHDRSGNPCWGNIITQDALGTVAGAAAAVVVSGGAAAAPNPLFGGLPSASVAGLIMGAKDSWNAQGNGGGGGNATSNAIFMEDGEDLCRFFPNHPDC